MPKGPWFTLTSPHVVIVGPGFGGLSAAKQLARAPFDVTVVGRHNYHLSQPLLYQVATAGLSAGDIASPIRGILHRQRNAKVSEINTAQKAEVAEGRRTPYCYLVLATGAEHAYFGHDWSSYAPGLKMRLLSIAPGYAHHSHLIVPEIPVSFYFRMVASLG